MPAIVPAPTGIYRQFMADFCAAIQRDTRLSSYFGWDDPPLNPDDDWLERRKILHDDSGTCPEEQSPALVVTEFLATQELMTLGDGGDVDSALILQLAVEVLVHIPRDSSGEAEKEQCSNLISAVVQSFMRWPVGPVGNDNLPVWDALYIVSDVVWSSTERLRRAGVIVHIEKWANTYYVD